MTVVDSNSFRDMVRCFDGKFKLPGTILIIVLNFFLHPIVN